MLSANELKRLSQAFETRPPQDILRWAIDQFWPDIALSSSFQTQSIPLLHMIVRIRPEIRIFFLDTGFHFWDTLLFREQMAYEWQLNVIDLRRDARWDVFSRQYGRSLPREDPDLCCYINKVQPMQKAMHGLHGWISGIRRDQTRDRAHAQILELQKDGLVKINPLLNWSGKDIQEYMEVHKLPQHPLFAKGYRSIGCAPCTAPIQANQDERAGRWIGRGKTECGLHTTLFQKNLVQARLSFLIQANKHQPGENTDSMAEKTAKNIP
ncbi:MAG: phosphoadenylyl-sulfate reductase [Chloroflexota bacterium]